MPRYLIVAYFIIIFPFFVSGQLYHYETGKVLGTNEPDQIIWKDGVFNNYPAEYGTLIVKENRSIRKSRLVNIPIVRVKALYPTDSLCPVFLLHGGPGESNLQKHLFFEELVQKRDVILVGYRGVDGSVKLNCPEMQNALCSDTLTLENAEQMFQNAALSCIESYKSQKIDIYGYSMDEVVADIEVTRNILKYDSISFLAFSYGTMLAQLYAQKYDSVVSKMVLIGARPLNDFLFDGNVLENHISDLYNKKIEYLKKKNEPQLIENVAMNLDKNEFNVFRLYILFFSKLYTINDSRELHFALNQMLLKESQGLKKIYSDFYEKFPSNLVFGDNILKKQGRVSYNSAGNLSYVAQFVNFLYNPQIDLLVSNDTIYNYPKNVPTLIIEGEYDITSISLNSGSQIETNNETNNETIVIKDCGHLDFFYTKEKLTKNLAIMFFNTVSNN